MISADRKKITLWGEFPPDKRAVAIVQCSSELQLVLQGASHRHGPWYSYEQQYGGLVQRWLWRLLFCAALKLRSGSEARQSLLLRRMQRHFSMRQSNRDCCSAEHHYYYVTAKRRDDTLVNLDTVVLVS
jgi:hypothetical protein